ncbi:MAG: zinc ribbon domain-containing protein [Lachnospiraceae bacterium]|nr:zinc ribbon domain-containing protein [Lachnospiraceae bacterium]
MRSITVPAFDVIRNPPQAVPLMTKCEGLRSNRKDLNEGEKVMKCSGCGTEVAEGVSFCPVCGAKIEGGVKSGLKLATMEPEQTTSAGGMAYSNAPAGNMAYQSTASNNMMYGYNGNPVIAGDITRTAGNAGYSTIAMDANEPLMDLEEYYRKDCSPKTKQFVKTGYVILYILGALNLILAFVAMGNSDLFMWKSSTGDGMLYLDSTMSLIGGAVLLIGAIGVHKLKSRVFAAVVLAYAIFSAVRGFIISHRISGWLLLLAGVYALYGTWQLHKDYENYKTMKTMIR